MKGLIFALTPIFMAVDMGGRGVWIGLLKIDRASALKRRAIPAWFVS
jgi:hypothetical protein